MPPSLAASSSPDDDDDDEVDDDDDVVELSLPEEESVVAESAELSVVFDSLEESLEVSVDSRVPDDVDGGVVLPSDEVDGGASGAFSIFFFLSRDRCFFPKLSAFLCFLPPSITRFCTNRKVGR